MDKAKEILRLHNNVGLSQRDIAKSVGCSLGTVSSVLLKAREAGIEYPNQLTSKELGTLLYPSVEKKQGVAKPEPDLEYIHHEMGLKGVTLQLLWEEYKIEHPDGLMYTQFCERYRNFRKQNDVYMRRHYKAGERVMIDWAGLTMHYYQDSEEKTAYIFVADLPATSYLYVEPFRDMAMSSWIEGHVKAFEYFGGVTRILVPDNTKTAVTKPDKKDPLLNKTYHEMAAFYGTAIVPARPIKPRDKAPVETGVKIAEQRIIAKLRNQTFLSFEELHTAVLKELEIVNSTPFKKLPSNRLSTFLEIEKPALLPLPDSRFEYAEWKIHKVAFDYHVEYDGHFYSVSYVYAGKEVEVRGTIRTIEIFFEHERIATHPRSYDKRNRYVTNPEHMPENHRAVVDWSPERFVSWASKIGPETEAYIRFVMSKRDHPEQAYKTCAGILRIGEQLPSEKMELICKDALKRNAYTYKYFSMIYKQFSEELKSEKKPIDHSNVRGSEYYRGKNNA
ncbi:MAG: IS21 family transposase [Smithella sp.]